MRKIFTLCLLLASTIAYSRIIYVKPTGNDNATGNSWATAYKTLRKALSVAVANDDIWVAAGTYYPDVIGATNNNDTTASFVLISNVDVYGGFAGTETAVSQRDLSTNISILSGDVDGDGTLLHNSENVLKSVSVTSARLDGFTITAGNSGSAGGAGMRNKYSTLTIANCIFSANTAYFEGGGIYNEECTITITDCAFNGNHVEYYGGGVYNYLSDATITGCTFSGNSAGWWGGGVSSASNITTQRLLLTNCQFSGNSSMYGGAVYNSLYIVVITSSIFIGNSASAEGGALQNNSMDADIAHCSFSNNTAPTGPTIHNSFTTLSISNSILWGNTPLVYLGELPDVKYSIVQGGFTGTGNINVDPLYVNATNDLRLLPCSPAIDSGSLVYATVGTDLDGNQRIVNGKLDMGAYEYQTPRIGGIIYVKANATGSNNGNSWANAFTKLQDGINAAQSCQNQQIWVAAGTYYPDEGVGQTNDNRFAYFTMKDGVVLYGGFAGGESSPSQRNWKNNITILSGEIQQNSDSSDNAYIVVRANSVSPMAVLDGFTITGGVSNSSEWSGRRGGGMRLTASRPIIRNCIFKGNYGYVGGAVYTENYGRPVFLNCLFYYNTGGIGGGGFLCDLSYPSLINCTMWGNRCITSGGGAIDNGSSSVWIGNSIIWGNSPTQITGPATVSYSIMQGGWAGTGNKSTDPQFVNAAVGDFRSFACSPGWNAGNNDILLTGMDKDLASTTRVEQGTVDIGAYEYHSEGPGSLIYVNSSATGSNNGLTWANAFVRLQDALAYANNCSEVREIWVARGTYYPDEGVGLANNNRSLSFQLRNDLHVIGGFSGIETDVGERSSVHNPTILSGLINAAGGPTASSYHVVKSVAVNSSALLMDFTITAGYASGSGTDNHGGGLYVESSSARFWNIIFSGNTALGSGGAVYDTLAHPNFYHCDFRQNSATTGGALYNPVGSYPTVNLCTFTRNQASASGGGIYNNSATPSILGSLFWGNHAENDGGAIYNASSSYSILSCSFARDTAQNGGAIANSHSNPVLVNSILWDNMGGELYNTSSTPEVSYCLIQGGYTGTAVRDLDPLFVNISTGDLHLQECSPAINAGNDDLSPGFVDLDNRLRMVNDSLDLGAYEYPSTPGNGCNPPVLTAPADFSLNNLTGSCGAIADFTGSHAATVTGGTGTVTVTYEPASGSTLSIGINTIQVMATDDVGRTSTASFIVTVVHSEAPVITAPQDITVPADGASCLANSIDVGQPTVSDNCPGVTYSGIRSDGNALEQPYPLGMTFIRWTATDVAGNTATALQTIVVEDKQKPVFTAPPDQNVNLGSACSFVVPDLLTGIVVTENCGTVVLTQSPAAGTVVPATHGTHHMVLITASDAAGNATNKEVMLTAVDVTPPMLTAPPNVDVNTDAGNCSATNVELGSPSAGDNCSLTGQTNNAPASFPIGKTEVIWTVTDAAGNSAVAIQLVTVQDKEAPHVITQPAVVTLNATGIGILSVAQVNNGSWDNCGISSIALSRNLFSCSDVGSNTVVLTVTDVHGNSATSTASVLVRDVTPPELQAPANITVSSDAGQCYATIVDLGRYTGMDACGFIPGNNAPADHRYPVGTTEVVYTATDVSGNSSTAVQTIVVRDTELPHVITQNAVVVLNATGIGSLSAAQVNNGSWDNCGISSVALSRNLFSCSDVGSNTVVLTVTDVHGNSATSTASVLVRDVTPPELQAPANITVSSDAGQCYATIVDLGRYTGMDACGFIPGNNAPADHRYPVGTTQVVYTATDVSGNSSTAVQTIVVRDTELPHVITQNAVVVLNATGIGSLSATQVNNGSWDNCGISSVALSRNLFSCSDVGSNTVVLTVTDVHGNSATSTASVLVRDVTPPELQAPANITVSSDAGQCYATIVDLGRYTGMDACGFIPGNNAPADHRYPVGTTQVVYTATDVSGNSSTAVQTIVVRDTELPHVLTQNAVVVLNATGIGSLSAAQVNNGSWDNCGISSVALSRNLFSCSDVGSNTVVLMVTDVHGNSATSTASVLVRDVTPPELQAPANITVSNDAGQCYATIVDLGRYTGMDACGFIPGNNAPADHRYPVGTTQVVYTATDVSGNSSTAVQTIVVQDTEPPHVITQPAVVTLNATGIGILSVAQVNNGSWDNCGISSVALSRNLFSCSDVGSNTVVLTVTDVHGNSATSTASVLVRDVTPPELQAPANITVSSDAGQCYATITDLGRYTGRDACGFIPSNNAPADHRYPVGTTQVVYTATDVSGNSSTAVQTIVVQDTEPPHVITQPAVVTLNATGIGILSVAQVNNGSWDNCGISSVALSRNLFSCSDVGSNTVVLTVTDVHGNSATSTASVLVRDVTPPELQAPANITVSNDAGQCYATITDLGRYTGRDACGFIPSNNAPADHRYPVGTTQVVYTATDASGNSSTALQTIVVQDTEPPHVVTKNISKALNTTTGLASLVPADVNNGSYDNCSALTLVSVVPSSFNCTQLGANTVTLTVRDASGNTATGSAVVTVTALTAVTKVFVTPLSQQYSDLVTFKATLSPGQVPGDCQPADSVVFLVGNQVMDTVKLEYNSSTGKLEASLLAPLYEIPNSSEMAPGIRNVQAVFLHPGTAFILPDATIPLVIAPEDARVTYTGSLFSSTSGLTSGQGTITLSATIQDISATVDAAGDNYPGDIRKARIRFFNADDGTPISGWLTPGLVNPNNLTTGTVTYNWNVNIGSALSISYTIGIEVGNYYTRNSAQDYSVVTISKPVLDFVTGGGYLIMQSSAGIHAGDAGTKNNFGFNVKFNKSGKNLQGGINIIVRRKEADGMLHVFQIKGNAMTSLAINGDITGSHPYPTAIFDGKASIQDVTDPLNVISIDGNASLHVEMTDKGDPGSSDMIAITVWDKDGGLWFASNWNGARTVEQLLAAGNLKINTNGTSVIDVQPTATILTASMNPTEYGQPVTFTATVAPVNGGNTIPSGKITFYDGTTALRTVVITTVQGVATATYSNSRLPVGTHTLTAVYSGDRFFASSVSAPWIQEVVSPSIVTKKEVSSLEATAYPNPAPYSFILRIRSSRDLPVNVRIIDQWGRVVETRSHLSSRSTLILGELYRPGTYYAEVLQGSKKITVKLIKQSD